MRTSFARGASASLGSALLLVLSTEFASALYFPQSELTLRIPYLGNDDGRLSKELTLLDLRTLRNDSSLPKSADYKITSTREKFATLVNGSGKILLNSLPGKGASKTIIVEATERGSDEAFLEISVQPIDTKGDRINCSDYVQDMCFWNVSKYQVYENRPPTMLGKIGPPAYREICPNFRITRYELLNGTDYFHIVDDEIFSNASLDRDSLKFPGGPGPHVRVRVRCVVWEEKTGNQHAPESNLSIDVLDEDDNPPVAQLDSHVQINLHDFTVGERLDGNELMVTDVDSITSNRYTVKILGDSHNALNITYDIMSIQHPLKPDDPASTAVFTRIFSRTTLLPKSPYTVVLQVTDESLLPGRGPKSVNITLSFVGPQHQATSTTTSGPLKKPISFPKTITIARASTRYSRIVKPTFKPNQRITFSIPDSRIFSVTAQGGIVYVANATLLQNAPSKIPLTIQWRSSEKRSSASLTVILVNATLSQSHACGDNQTASMHSCANAMTRKECESHCGIGSGSFNGTAWSGECVWRSDNPNNAGKMTTRYETCTPNLSHCPDNVCDELEQLDHRICPQDCTIESETHFAVMNK